MLRKLEHYALLTIIAGGVVVFAFAVAHNPTLLDWMPPVMLCLGVLVWLFFDRPQRQH